jgi:hypothetical protein
MSYDLDKLDALIKATKAVMCEVRKGKKAAQNPKRQQDANAYYRQANIHAHEVHCLCVELGIADPEESRYGVKLIDLGYGRNIQRVFRRPEGI